MKITEEFFLSSRREILEGRMFDEEEIKVILTLFLRLSWDGRKRIKIPQ